MRQRRWLAVLLALAMAAPVSVLLAGEGMEHGSKSVFGTVKTVQKDKIEIETPDGKKVTIAVSPDTKFTKDGKDLTRDAVEPGMKVAMEVTSGEHGGMMMCRRMILDAEMDDMHSMHEGSGMHHGHSGDEAKKDEHPH